MFVAAATEPELNLEKALNMCLRPSALVPAPQLAPAPATLACNPRLQLGEALRARAPPEILSKSSRKSRGEPWERLGAPVYKPLDLRWLCGRRAVVADLAACTTAGVCARCTWAGGHDAQGAAFEGHCNRAEQERGNLPPAACARPFCSL